MVKIFDAHTHPNCAPLCAEFPEIYATCTRLEVAMNVVGNDLTDSQVAVEMAQRPGVFATVGIHPNECHRYEIAAAEQALIDLLEGPGAAKIVAIGECGLDNSRPNADPVVQAAFFRMQIRLAIRYNKALMCHIREAHPAALQILAQERPERVIIHCFTADAQVARQYVDLGCYLSIPGVVTYRGAHDLRAALPTIPVERLLLETDAPFLAPVPFRGRTNYPYYVLATLVAVANLLEMDVDKLAQKTWKNTVRALNLKENPWQT